jgi:hypothetical protein
MSLLSRLERALGRFAIPNITLYLVLGQVTFWSVSFFRLFDLERIALLPLAVRAGEVWRLFSFLLQPPNSHPVFIAFAWYLFYLMGSALENHWGVFRYNLFIFLGWALTVAAAFLFPFNYATNLFLAGSVFLAFAFLYPDFEMLLFFILPVKIKWLALIAWIGYGFSLLFGSWPVRLAVLAAIGNFLVFFAGEIIQRIKTGRRRMAHQARQFGASSDSPEPRHRCHTCGKTNVSHPQLDFRYCSKCAGDECYCAEHIFSHEHVVAGTAAKK